MAGLNFRTTIEIYNGNPYVLITAKQATELQAGWRKPMPVKVQINGQPKPAWHINMMPIGDGSFYLYLHGEVRTASNTKVGDEVEVRVSFNNDYKSGPIPMPDWFARPLRETPGAKAAWDALIPSRQKEMLRYIAGLKSVEARERNVQKAMEVLSGKPARFMARSWKHGK